MKKSLLLSYAFIEIETTTLATKSGLHESKLAFAARLTYIRGCNFPENQNKQITKEQFSEFLNPI